MIAVKLLFLGAVVGVAMVQGSPSPITPAQISVAIAALKELIKNELQEDYMNEDYWLAKWLDNKNYNVKDAFLAIRQHLEYRLNENIATILDEDWSDMRARFPYSRNTTDKSGQPLLYIDVGAWDTASFLAEYGDAGVDRIVRYEAMFNEESEAHVRQLRSEGRDVTKYSYIVNMAGLGASKHLCRQCFSVSTKAANVLTPYVPVHVDKTSFVNVPYLYKALYNLLSGESQSSAQLYGQNRDQWEASLVKNIEKDQFPGGLLAELSQVDNKEGLMFWKNQEL